MRIALPNVISLVSPLPSPSCLSSFIILPLPHPHTHSLCLCHSWVPELEHIISRCHFINLLPANTLQAILQAVSAGRVPVGIASHIVGNMSEGQRRHVGPQIWVGLMEHFCQYGKANMVVKIQQICKELELTVPDMVRIYTCTYTSSAVPQQVVTAVHLQTYTHTYVHTRNVNQSVALARTLKQKFRRFSTLRLASSVNGKQLYTSKTSKFLFQFSA